MPDPILTGRLELVGLPSLLQLVESEALTGRLLLAGQARLGLHDGSVVTARYDGLDGRTAALEAFLLGRGAFELAADEIEEEQPLGDTIELLMTGCRLLDEWSRLAPLHLHAIDEVRDVGLQPLLPHLGVGPVHDAVRRAGLPRAITIDPLLNGIEQGWLREIEGRPTSEPPLVGDDDVDSLIDLARSHARARRLDEAEELLLRALRLRPGDRIASQNLSRVQHLREHPAMELP
ncbi:MAG TPA: DUF4388 domain-containing protein [Deltaproteobacteria bacterium]|nr:DUF4388 domain-containing protein [Deltaproteobacteria bacterium]